MKTCFADPGNQICIWMIQQIDSQNGGSKMANRRLLNNWTIQTVQLSSVGSCVIQINFNQIWYPVLKTLSEIASLCSSSKTFCPFDEGWSHSKVDVMSLMMSKCFLLEIWWWLFLCCWQGFANKAVHFIIKLYHSVPMLFCMKDIQHLKWCALHCTHNFEDLLTLLWMQSIVKATLTSFNVKLVV